MTQPEIPRAHQPNDEQLSADPVPTVPEAPNSGAEAVAETLTPVDAWARGLYEAELARVQGEVDRRVPWKVLERDLPREQRGGEPSVDGMVVVAVARAERLRRRVLEAIGLHHMGDMPFDQFAQTMLPYGRRWATLEPADAVAGQLDRFLGRSDAERKRLATAPEAVQRETLAWEFAKEEARRYLVTTGAAEATAAELEAVTTKLQGPSPKPEQRAPARGDVQILNGRGEQLPVATFFAEQGESPFSVEQWCTLPTRPIVRPAGKPPADPAGLAEWLFDNVLYSAQVCDRKGQAVGLSPAVRQDYVDKITFAISQGVPIVATEYAPLVAISNPIKRNTQQPSLTEIDMFRRLSEVAHAVELYYPPGMQWLLGNEATVFQGPHFGLPESYVRQFHERCRYLMCLVDPEGTRLQLFDQAELLWGTLERQADWEAYERCKLEELQTAFYDHRHPEHDAVRKYLATYVYPMATCISPYRFEPAQGLSVREISEAYATLKLMTGSVIRGVGSAEEEAAASATLTRAQAALLDQIHEAAIGLTFQYRVTMDSRDELPAFSEALPGYAIRYTMVTKRDKLVLYPNSGRGAYFPAHGEAVLVRPKDSRQRTAVTVRPWWQIAGAPDRYVPMYVEGREEPLYFEEK